MLPSKFRPQRRKEEKQEAAKKRSESSKKYSDHRNNYGFRHGSRYAAASVAMSSGDPPLRWQRRKQPPAVPQFPMTMGLLSTASRERQGNFLDPRAGVSPSQYRSVMVICPLDIPAAEVLTYKDEADYMASEFVFKHPPETPEDVAARFMFYSQKNNGISDIWAATLEIVLEIIRLPEEHLPFLGQLFTSVCADSDLVTKDGKLGPPLKLRVHGVQSILMQSQSRAAWRDTCSRSAAAKENISAEEEKQENHKRYPTYFTTWTVERESGHVWRKLMQFVEDLKSQLCSLNDELGKQRPPLFSVQSIKQHQPPFRNIHLRKFSDPLDARMESAQQELNSAGVSVGGLEVSELRLVSRRGEYQDDPRFSVPASTHKIIKNMNGEVCRFVFGETSTGAAA